MKKIFLLLMVLCSGTVYGQGAALGNTPEKTTPSSATEKQLSSLEKRAMARVQKMEGIEIYIMSEPLRDYDIVEEYAFPRIKKRGRTNQEIAEEHKNALNVAAQKAAQKTSTHLQTVDAIIYTGGDHATMIRFKDRALSSKGLARVYKISGREMYVMCDPMLEYEIAFDMTHAVDYDENIAVSENLGNLMKEAIIRSKESFVPFDALIYTGGNNAVAVRFKK